MFYTRLGAHSYGSVKIKNFLKTLIFLNSAQYVRRLVLFTGTATATKKRGKEKKKMCKGDFLCVGTVLGLTNYQTI